MKESLVNFAFLIPFIPYSFYVKVKYVPRKYSSTLIWTIKLFLGQDFTCMLIQLFGRNDVRTYGADQVVFRSGDTDKLFGVVIISFGHSMGIPDMGF